jgi:predicted dienelactone hydrolase
MRWPHFLPAFLFFAANCAAQSPSSDVFFSVPLVDAPELAPRGPYSVGVRTIELKNPSQPDILNFDKSTGKVPLYDRSLTVEIWYPATIPADAEERTWYVMSMPGSSAPDYSGPKSLTFAGKALRGAPPATGKSFPLVIVSHGFPGSRFFLSYLTENLASKGYIVAAIDHTDSVTGSEKGFQSTLLNRASDQLFTVAAIEELSHRSDHFLHGLVDEKNVAIIGYSMGGYGALASAGAGYSKKSPTSHALIPGDYFDDWTAGSPKYKSHLRKEIKAVVAIAPWGAQPPNSLWEPESFAAIHIPLLFIAGDQDDISDFRNGIKPAFEQSTHSDRCMLVYENARHNVGGNPPPPDFTGTFSQREFFEEPVWRKDRITAINQHFITAFLDLYLKGDESRRSFLHPTPENSNDGTWPLARGESAGAKFSDGATYWKGFQRRWSLGLQMHCSSPTP